MLLTEDGVELDATHDPAADGSRELAVVVVHGFTGSLARPQIRAVVAVLRARAGVVALDLRGHGRSGGASTVGQRERLDLDAAVGWARALGYRRVATLGFSLGAATVLQQAAAAAPGSALRPDAVVAVSAPSRWNYRGTAAMRRLHRGISTAPGRAVLATAFGTRVRPVRWQDDPFDAAPLPPDAAVGLIPPTPLLLVHGDRDQYFPVEHLRWLERAARGGAQTWLEPGMGHAEHAAGPALVSRIADWVRDRIGP